MSSLLRALSLLCVAFVLALLFGGDAATWHLGRVTPAEAAGAEMPASRADIEAIVHDYILAHPEIIQEAMQALDKQQADAQAASAKQAVQVNAAAVYDSPHQVVIGNPEAPITLVEFFDYNCGFCKRAMSDMQTILQDDKDVRIVLKEFPILSAGSVEAAKVAVAVRLVAPEKYLPFHLALLGGRGEANEARALEAVQTAGIDVDAVKARIGDPEVLTTLQESMDLAAKLSVSGTPTYVLADDMLFGAVGLDELQTKIAAVRTCGKTSC